MNRLLSPKGLVVSLAAVALGCGAVNTVTFEADETATIELAEQQSFKYCFIQAEQVCQSPDSLLVFHLPRELEMSPAQLTVVEEMSISNNGFEPIVIDAYHLTLTDDQNVVYYPDFTGPEGYSEVSSRTPALVLMPTRNYDIRFSETLRTGSNRITGVTFFYRLEGESEHRRVVVSYKPATRQDVLPRAPGA